MNEISKKAYYIFLSTIFFISYTSYIVSANQYEQDFNGYYTLYLEAQSTNNSSKYPVNNQNGFGVRKSNNSSKYNSPTYDNKYWNYSGPNFEYTEYIESELQCLPIHERNAGIAALREGNEVFIHNGKVVIIQNNDAEDKSKKAMEYAAKEWQKAQDEQQARRKQEADNFKKSQETARINQQKNTPRLCFDNPKDLDPIVTNCKKLPIYKSGNNEFKKRLEARSNAIEQTRKQSYKCFDYYSQVKHPKFTDSYADIFNNCYGTALDKQLHEELCDTRIAMMDLQIGYADNLQVRAFAPLIYQATAQAKTERNAEKAFNLSDFSYDLVRIVTGGVRLMVLAINDPSIAARGIASGVKTTCNPQHWLDMGMGLIKFTILLADEYGRQESSDTAFDYGTLMGGKYDLFLEKSNENKEYHRKIRQAIQQEFHETSEKLKNMSDEQLIEGVFSFGTTFVLDGLALKAASLATTIEGRALLNQCADALSSPFAKEYVLEVAGIGKLSLEEGADIANMAIEAVEKNPELLAGEKSVTDGLYEVAKDIKASTGQISAGSNIVTASDVPSIINSATLSKKGGESIVGHALQKHAGRHPEIWNKVKGNAEMINNMALKHLQEIIDAPGSFEKVKNNVGIEFLEKRLFDGRGVRLNLDKTFKGFID